MRGLHTIEGRRLKDDIEEVRELCARRINGGPRVRHNDARTIRTLKKLVHRAERYYAKALCLQPE
jgi:hypothetical protein